MSSGGEGTATSAQQKRDFSEEARSTGDPACTSEQSKKRRAGGSASSRGVANLTPDQLAKKRANDREAQRAIRERTKNQIEGLERRIRDLTSQQPYQELQHALRQKEQVEAENVDIKKRLASVLSLIQPILGQQGIEPQTLLPPGPYAFSPHPFAPNRPASSPNQNAITPNSVPSPVTSGPQWHAQNASMDNDPRSYPQPPSAHTQQFVKQRYDMTHNLDMGPEKLDLEFLLDGSQHINKVSNGVNGTHNSSSFQHSRGSDSESPSHQRSNSIGSHAQHNGGNTEMTGHAAPIRNGPATCPLDNLLLDFLHERQQQAADGVATPKLVGPAYPSVSSLLNPSQSINSHPLSKVFTDILTTFPDLSALPEKVAVLYIMFLIMRWQISPTQENYDRLPDWVTPRASQLFTPHPAWIDHLPWPKMRDRLVRNYNSRDYIFENWFIPYTTTLSVNWPYEPTDTLLSSPENDDLMINPVFERHMRRLENWSLGPAFAKAFPGLQDTYRLKNDVNMRS